MISLHFLVLFMGTIVLFQLTFTFIYSTLISFFFFFEMNNLRTRLEIIYLPKTEIFLLKLLQIKLFSLFLLLFMVIFHFLVLFIGITVLFQLTFTFIYNILIFFFFEMNNLRICLEIIYLAETEIFLLKLLQIKLFSLFLLLFTVPLHFLVLFMSITVLFQLTFTFIYSTLISFFFFFLR